MKTQQFLQTSLNGWRTIPRRWGWLSLSLLFVATLVLYAARQSAPALVGAGVNDGAQNDAATQSVLNYIRVHENMSEHALALDPAAQSVADYLRVHSAVSEQPAPRDAAAALGVADYLRAHSNVSTSAQTDPAIQSVLNYIRVHDSISDHPAAVDAATQGILDYLRAHGN